MNRSRHQLRNTALGATAAGAVLVLIAVLVTALAPTSATSGPGAQNRVGAFFSAAPNHAQGVARESACTHPGSIGARPGIAVGFCVADETGSIGGYPGELGGAIGRGGRFNDPRTAFKQLEARYGIEERVLSERFHKIKPGGGAGARDDTLIDLTGNVYDTTTGERLGQIIVRQGG